MSIASVVLGAGIGAAMTAAYTAAGRVIPPNASGAGFGVLTSASLTGMAVSPIVAGFAGGTSIAIVFALNVVLMIGIAIWVARSMTEGREGIRD